MKQHSTSCIPLGICKHYNRPPKKDLALRSKHIFCNSYTDPIDGYILLDSKSGYINSILLYPLDE